MSAENLKNMIGATLAILTELMENIEPPSSGQYEMEIFQEMEPPKMATEIKECPVCADITGFVGFGTF